MRYDAVRFLEDLFQSAENYDLVPDLSPLPEDLPADWLEWFEERLAIMQHLGKVPLEHLEARALTCTLEAMRGANVPIPRRRGR